MSILKRHIRTGAFLFITLFLTAYPAFSAQQEPIAQVFDVRGKVTVKSAFDNSTSDVKKGNLLGAGDILTLDTDAQAVIYLKSGGKKELKAQDARTEYKVSDLVSRAEPYSKSAQVFGASRGQSASSASPAADFFFPQEALILDTPPLIEFTVFHGTGEVIALGTASIQIVKNGAMVDSMRFNNLAYGLPQSCQFPKLEAQTEYRIELRLELQKVLGNVAISFPLYIAGIADAGLVLKYGPFSDPVFRSFETAGLNYKGAQRTITAFKQLVTRGPSSRPVVVIELFIL
ncbi:MAG TPA: hypothetical protein PK107_02570 [Candidatus Omnitrophota bacterium]|nr:hypothetical protein [Candidatus Omnitrophota bacterium]HQO37681.1 hypothetical protein [Candidatus Omnitrophota bacterium]